MSYFSKKLTGKKGKIIPSLDALDLNGPRGCIRVTGAQPPVMLAHFCVPSTHGPLAITMSLSFLALPRNTKQKQDCC